MSDLTGLTLTTTRPTTNQPALIAWSAAREAKRREREAWRVAQIRRAEAATRAAAESIHRRPATVTVTPAAVKREQSRKIVECTVDGCGVMTRGRHLTAEQVPNTRRRDSQGRCPDCAAQGGSPTGVRKALPMDDIAAEYRAGASLLDLSVKYGSAKSTIRTRLMGHGVTIRPHGGNGRRGGAA